jgi:annexin A7/11
LLAYISTPRYEGPEFDQLVVEEDAKQIYKAGEKRIGTDEKTFIRIFSERSTTHLAAVNTAYKTSFGNTLEKVNIIKVLNNGPRPQKRPRQNGFCR